MASNGGEEKSRVAAGYGGGGYGYGGYEGRDDRKWWPWLVPTVIVACIAVFIVEMYVNNCPKHGSALGGCVAGFLRRFSFQPLRENPLLGPSSATYVLSTLLRFFLFYLVAVVHGVAQIGGVLGALEAELCG
jgi:hypothetical protein